MPSERKIEILQLVGGGDWWTSSEVASHLGLRHGNASELLRRYAGDGLLVRQRWRGPEAPPRAYLYGLTQKGADRLAWFNESEWEVDYE